MTERNRHVLRPRSRRVASFPCRKGKRRLVVSVPADRPVSANFARWSDGNPSQRYLQHYAIRTRKLEECAEFYEDVFGFSHKKPAAGDP